MTVSRSTGNRDENGFLIRKIHKNVAELQKVGRRIDVAPVNRLDVRFDLIPVNKPNKSNSFNVEKMLDALE